MATAYSVAMSQIPPRRDGDIATLYAVAIYRGTGRCRCRPAFRGPFQNPQTSTQKRREESMAVTENTLILETTQGPVTIEMRPDLAPGHVARIKELVREGFYDGIVFHRVIDGFMAQTGCPQRTGTGGYCHENSHAMNHDAHKIPLITLAPAARSEFRETPHLLHS